MSQAAAAAESAPGTGLRVHRGPFEQTALLTGELEATRARTLTVPRTPSWRIELRWIAEDGTAVHAGDRVAELDKSEFVQDLEDKELKLQEKLSELDRKKAEALSDTRDKEFEVAKAEAELEKAKIKADLPKEIVPRQELADRQLDEAKAETELATARDELAAQKRSSAADVELQEIDIATARREIEVARAAIDDLTIRAPEDGLFLVANLRWEDRKLQVGDTVWAGLSLGTIPDLSSLRVSARLPDVDDGQVAVGMPARVILDAYPDRVYRGKVTQVTPIAQDEGGESLRRFFRVELSLDASDPQRMIPGMSARVEVVRQTEDDALLAPRSGLALGAPGAQSAHARLAGGRLVPVRLGPCNALECVVEDGLAAGTELVAGTTGGTVPDGGAQEAAGEAASAGGAP